MRLIPVYNILFLIAISIIPHTLLSAEKKIQSAEEAWLAILNNSAIKQQIVTLKTNKGPATALYLAQSSGQPQGGLIILHGRQQHPDWQELISPLRTQFPKFGWSTLSLQLPLQAETTNTQDYKKYYLKSLEQSLARIDAAILFLNSQKIRNIVIVGYEIGANTATWYLVKRPKVQIQALISISLLSFSKPVPLNANRSLSLIKQPVLDVYATNDTNDILKAVAQRKPFIKQHRSLIKNNRDPRNVRYRQLEIEGADHSYSGFEHYLTKRLRSWLRVFAPGKSVSRVN